LKDNVIFAMEEPEIAIPPHTQKRIVDSVRKKSAQALFTSHSPYVLQEFPPEQVLVVQRDSGTISVVPSSLPPTVKNKTYKEEFRKRFCEALLARRVLIAEGRTEYDAFPAAARRLHELHAADYKTLEALGVAVLDAGTDSQVAPLGHHFGKLGKVTFAVFDKQDKTAKATIIAAVKHPFESPEDAFEKLLVKEVPEAALRRYGLAVVAAGDWPPHLAAQAPTATMLAADLTSAIYAFLDKEKGSGVAADLLSSCTKDEMPKYIVETLTEIQKKCEPPPPAPPAAAPAVATPAAGGGGVAPG
jgi:putative ATP-dependent endonuclease of the OLD family